MPDAIEQSDAVPATRSPDAEPVADPAGAPRPFVLLANGARDESGGALRVSVHDFRNPSLLTETDLRRLRALHEDFARYLSARLSMSLRMECGLRLDSLRTLPYGRFVEELPEPAPVCLFKVEPFPGLGLLAVDSGLSLAFVDRLLGGRGQAAEVVRPLTEIEVALLEDVLRVVLDEWCARWGDKQPIEARVVGHESDGRFLQTSPRDATVLAFVLEATFGGRSGRVRLALPFPTIEPLVKTLQKHRPDAPRAAAAPAPRAEWRPVYDEVGIPVLAEWRLADAALREIAALRVGDVIKLPLDILDRTRVLLGGAPKFVGTVGIEGDTVAVQIAREQGAADEEKR